MGSEPDAAWPGRRPSSPPIDKRNQPQERNEENGRISSLGVWYGLRLVGEVELILRAPLQMPASRTRRGTARALACNSRVNPMRIGFFGE